MSKSEYVKKVFSKAPASPTAALDAFNMLVKSHHDYKVIAQQEKTKRADIEAWKDTRIASIQAQKELLHDYLARTFAERHHVIDEMFARLDKGIEDGNMEVMNMAMNSIVNIVQSSPLKEARQIMQELYDPNVKRIEF